MVCYWLFPTLFHMYWRRPCAMQPNKIRNSCCQSFSTRLFVSIRCLLSKLKSCRCQIGKKSNSNYGTKIITLEKNGWKSSDWECHTLSLVMNWGIWSVARLIFVHETISHEREREKENPISSSFVLMAEQKHQVCDLSLQCQVWIDNTQILTRYWMLALWLFFFNVL